MTTLQEAIHAIESFKIKIYPRKNKNKIADQLLGEYQGILPKNKTSTEFIRDLRNSLYGKIKISINSMVGIIIMRIINKPRYKKKVNWEYISKLKYNDAPIFSRDKKGDDELIYLLKMYKEKEHDKVTAKHIPKGESGIAPTLLGLKDEPLNPHCSAGESRSKTLP